VTGQRVVVGTDLAAGATGLLDGIEAVVFDVDGTLVDHDRAQREALRRRLADVGHLLTDDEWSRWRELEEHHFARYLDGEIDFEQQRHERVRAFLGEPMGKAAAREWFRVYLAHFEASWTLFPDVLDTVDELLARGLALAAFSNVHGGFTRHKLATVGIADRFTVVWGTDDVRAAKPDRAVFDALRRELARSARATLHVGDRYEADARGAVRADLRGVWLDRPGADPRGRTTTQPHDPRVAVIASLRELVVASG
jgi:putative hydrolase of the HAD superfamily